MGLSISTARQDLLSSLVAYRDALQTGDSASPDSDDGVGASDAVGGGNAAGAACGVDDADAPAGDVDASQDAPDDDPRNTSSTTQSEELLEMLQLMKMFMDALIQQNQQNQQGQQASDDSSQPDDGFSPISSPSGNGTPASQAPEPVQAGGAPGAGDAGGAPPVGGGDDAAAGQAPAADNAGQPAEASGPASASGAAPSGGGPVGDLSTAAQTTALTGDQSAQVASQWKQNLQKDFGLTNEQAAGIVGNLWHESGGMNSGITQGGAIGEPNANMADDNGNGYGIAQWGGTRKQGLIDFADKNGLPPSSQAANYGFLKQELSGPYAGAIDAVKGTGDVASATAAFANAFEKPSDPQMASRVALAEKVA